MASVAENAHFFEGTEKLLELWFASDSDQADLRTIERSLWEDLLETVHCTILSIKRSDLMVAFVLSESSMFVSKNRFILKTCGKTTLLAAVEPLIKLVKEQCGFNKIVDVFYSRKNFMRPELQHTIHQSFEDEVSHLDELFSNGAAYALGRINRDCWYLYTIDYIGVVEPDQTLELLMQDLDLEQMEIFTKRGSESAAVATKRSKIADLLPGTIIDDFLFEPCGYSMNGILPEGHYFTIHITPEMEFSYVSFETNIPKSSYAVLITKVLKIFQPGKFLMTLFANEGSLAQQTHKELQDFNILQGYRRADHQYCQLKNYNLTYTMYHKNNKGSTAYLKDLDVPDDPLF